MQNVACELLEYRQRDKTKSHFHIFSIKAVQISPTFGLIQAKYTFKEDKYKKKAMSKICMISWKYKHIIDLKIVSWFFLKLSDILKCNIGVCLEMVN